jgi:hypothetical protein
MLDGVTINSTHEPGVPPIRHELHIAGNDVELVSRSGISVDKYFIDIFLKDNGTQYLVLTAF